MTDTYDTLASDTVAAARVPPGHVQRETSAVASALRAMATESRANSLDETEIAQEAQAVVSVTRGALTLRYTPEVAAP